jgi:signal transduction histidine kinase
MMARRPGLLSSETFDPEPTSGRLLAALSSPVRLFITIAVTFSVLGGLLQVVGSARGPLARPLTTALTVHIAGNLVASAIAIILVVAVHRTARSARAGRSGRSRRWVSVRAAALGGAIGGAARLPLELLVGSDLSASDAAASMLTEVGWFAIAALAANTLARLAGNERATREALSEALHLQTLLRTQMLEADLQTRREVAEWLHGHLQAELLLAADQVRHLGPEGDAAATRLAQLRDAELRSFTRSLHPTLAEVDLVGALHELGRRFASSTNVSADVDRALVRASLPASVAVAAYRVCEEAVTNAVKHGAARDVTITLRRDPDAGQLMLVVEDDGTGGSDSSAPGLGLALVDTYVRTIGGTWDLQLGERSGEAGRTGGTLTVTVPLGGPTEVRATLLVETGALEDARAGDPSEDRAGDPARG